MGFWSSVGSFCSSVGSAVSRGASALYNKAKEIAGQAIGWMAEKAEGFVQSTKAAWQVVKPFVQKAQVFIRAAAAAAPLPWLKSALLALDKGITALCAFENSPIAKKIDAAIKWSIQLAKQWQASRKNTQSAEQQDSAEQEEELTDEELATAQKHQATFHEVEMELDDEQARELCELAASINDFKIAKTLLAKALDSEPADFEHYLRLRATQKLLKMADVTFQDAKTIDDIGLDILFLVRTASNLVKADPELSIKTAKKLDRILNERYGTTLAPFVFEEVVGSWGAMTKDLNAQWTDANKKLAQMNVALKSLTLSKQLQGELAPEEEVELTRLQKEIPVAKTKLHDLDTQRTDIARYVGAIEGFLQLLEKSQEEIEANGHSYLFKDGAKVGMILMRCAQKNLFFKDFEPDEQDLITDYAKIFSGDAEVRMERVLEVTA